MKNNEILIIVKINSEQFVLKTDSNISYKRLKEGIKTGLEKKNIKAPDNWKLSFKIKSAIEEDDEKSLRELGFVTGTILSQNEETDRFFEATRLTNQLFNKRYDSEEDINKRTMMYNISTRFITEIEETTVNILPSGKPPQPPNNNIFVTLVPSALSLGVMYGLRAFLIPEASAGMIMFMYCSFAGTIAAQICRHFITKYNFKKSRKTWKSNYENYLERICKKIEMYQEQDVEYLDDCFPSVENLIKNINSLNIPLFSHSVNDFDFMNLRLGNSRQVASVFKIQHDFKDEIDLGVTFYTDEDNKIKINLEKPNRNSDDGKTKNFIGRLSEYLKSDILIKKQGNKHYDYRYLNELSEYLATDRYRFLKEIKIPRNDGENNDNCEYKYPALIVDFKNCGALGCVSFNYQDVQTRLIDHIVLELVCNHKPQDLQFVLFAEPENNKTKQEKRISHYRCLPHFNELFNDMSQFAFNEESAGKMFSRLETIMNNRMAEQQSQDEEKETFSDKYQQIVCIFEYDYKLKDKAFSRYLPVPPKQGEQYVNKNGLTFIFAVNYKELLPQYCGIVLECVTKNEDNKKENLYICNDDDYYGTIKFHNQIKYRNRTTDEQCFENRYIFKNDDSIKKEYDKAFSQLSTLYSLHIQERGSVPDKVNLFELYFNSEEKVSTESIAEYIKKQWKKEENDVTKTLSVPIGKGESEIVCLDLHEDKDGPHMLVAGTTGSGKSETMLTYLIGLCMRFSPQHLNLMLVDMKGNSFAGRLKDLPHCVATVDNVSGQKDGFSSVYVLKRFLELLKSEIKRRESIFEDYGVDKLDVYIKTEQKITELLDEVSKNSESDQAENKLNTAKKLSELSAVQQKKFEELKSNGRKPPVLGHLVFVVDEFTELKRFGNETDTNYIGEITSIARIGRTLGLHMILVSQNIENAITDDIRINTNARICLKVATKSASKEMLDGRTDAYYSDMPKGRGYFLVGSGSTYKYFQSGYASENMEKISEPQTVITQLNTCGEHTVFYDSYLDKPELKHETDSLKKDNTQLNAVISAINKIAEENKQGQKYYRKPDDVFPKLLENVIEYSDIFPTKAKEVNISE